MAATVRSPGGRPHGSSWFQSGPSTPDPAPLGDSGRQPKNWAPALQWKTRLEFWTPGPGCWAIWERRGGWRTSPVTFSNKIKKKKKHFVFKELAADRPQQLPPEAEAAPGDRALTQSRRGSPSLARGGPGRGRAPRTRLLPRGSRSPLGPPRPVLRCCGAGASRVGGSAGAAAAGPPGSRAFAGRSGGQRRAGLSGRCPRPRPRPRPRPGPRRRALRTS